MRNSRGGIPLADLQVYTVLSPCVIGQSIEDGADVEDAEGLEDAMSTCAIREWYER